MLIYKLLGADEWARAQAEGVFRGSPVDIADGFIHFSTGEQVVETAARHFAGRRGLVLLAVDPDRLGDALRWEVSRHGDLFPHLYASMSLTTVVSETPLAEDVEVDQAVRSALSP